MAIRKITEKTTTDLLKNDAYVLITQTETVNGQEIHSLRRIPFTNFAALLGADLDFDEETETLHLLNQDGVRIGMGTTIVAGISGLRMYTETDDTGTQYLILVDSDGNELTRTEFTVTGTGGTTSYVVRLINGMSGTKLSYPSGQACEIRYEFYEYYAAEQTTVNAACEVYVKNGTGDYALVRSQTIQQGANSVIVTPYLKTGTNYVKLQVTAGESGTVKVLVYTVNVVDISLTSSFDAAKAYSSSISFPYRVTGRGIRKTMFFTIDGVLYDKVDIGTSHNVQLTETINLAAHGHGDHLLKCWFETKDGAVSPALTYDIIYNAGGSAAIISSVFDIDEVAYGELITVQYVVFTNGGDYTDEVHLDIYTIEDGQKVYFRQSTLANVVNEAMQTWNITEYPSDGTIYLEISAGTARKTFSLEVIENTGDRDLSGVSTRLIAAYSASGRTNSDADRESMNAAYTSIDDITTNIIGTLTGFNWRSNGWMSDADGFPVLRVSGGAKVNIDLPFFASSWTDGAKHTINLAGTPTAVGRTFEVAFKTQGVTDESDALITVWDAATGTGVKIFPSRAYLLSSTMSVTTDADGNILNKNAIPYVPYSSQQGKVRLTFVIEEVGHYVEVSDNNANKQLIRIYVNGQLAKALAYTTDSFTTNEAKPQIAAENCLLDVYSMRFYDYALTDADVLKNYIADLPSLAERIEVYDQNNITDDGGDISLTAAALQYPCMVLTGALSSYKGHKVKIGCQLYKPDGSMEDGYYVDWDFMDTDADGNYGNVNNVQGTSSQYYIKKNYKITFYRLENGVFKKAKVAIFDDRIPVSTICIKADYMSPDSANTGNANFWQGTFTEQTPPQKEDSRVQTAVMGYPILVFQRGSATDTPTFIGRYNLNNDKSNSEAFGLENSSDSGNNTKCQKWEYCDNSEAICNFLTDELHALRTGSGGTYEAWEDALESCYPDQGDLEDEGLAPNLDYLQTAYTWICRRADFLSASGESGTGGVYGGETYDTEAGLKKAIFRAEFEKHFNLTHTLHYFIANEIPLLVDNFAKNMFLTCYDVTAQRIVDSTGNPIRLADITTNGVVNAAAIDWEKSTFAVWYPTLYDLDSCLGADNNGYDQFPYYAEMWDTYNNGIIVNGANSRFWKLVYAAFYDELKALYCTIRDEKKTLTPTLYMQAMIDNLTHKLPIVAVNADERFKYIEAYEGGYYDGSTDAWVYTLGFLYLAKSTMESYHRDFITKRFAMIDSKYLADAYTQDYVTLRVNRAGISAPEELAFDIAPCQAMYCYTEWGNSGSYIGGKCLEGETIRMQPASSGNWYDIVLSVYGASHIKSLGDLSVLYPSKFINLSQCSNLTELIAGSSAEGYENPALDSIADVSYLVMLQRLNICNCTALSGTVDLSSCDLIEEVYATGSSISAIVLPEGGYLKKLYLPGSITGLDVISHAHLADFRMDSYGGLLRLRVENTPNIPTDEILMARGTSIARIRLVGINWTLKDETALRILADDSMASKAIDANGNAVDSAGTWPTVTGTVEIDRIRGSLLDRLNEKYPNLTIHYKTKYHAVRFVDWDGTQISYQEINDNDNASSPSAPFRANTAQYVHAFRGWDYAYTNVKSDLTLTAQYSSVLQQYDVEFYFNEGDTDMLAKVDAIPFGTEYRYPDELPTKKGHIFTGWQDGEGNIYRYIQQMPDASAKIDENGMPLTIRLFTAWEAVEMPGTSKSFAQLTDGERLFCAIAIQTGEAEGCTVNYYADTMEYIITDTATLATVNIGVGDYQQFTLYNGETLTRQIADFNHDFSDLEGTKPVGITYMMKNCLAETRQMNPSFKHCFHYQIGEDEPIVSDDEDYASATNAAALEKLDHSHTATGAEVAAGYVEIKSLGQTYLRSIVVAHADGSTTTWELDKNGFYVGEDSETCDMTTTSTSTAEDGSTVTTTYRNTWYASDIPGEGDDPVYKIGKMLQSLGLPIVNVNGVEQENGYQSTTQLWVNLTGRQCVLAEFGGIKLDATGVDTLNTAQNNQFNGNGVSRIVFMADWLYDWNNFTEVSEGAIISVPVVEGDVVTVKAYGLSRNWGGWDNSALKKWANSEFLDLLPLSVRNTIIPVSKTCNLGNRSYTVKKGLSAVWTASNIEIGSNTGAYPNAQEGKKYPIFTNDASRIKSLADGAGDVCHWWERSPHRSYSSYFYGVGLAGGPYYSNWASGRLGVCLGFCSGAADQ